MRAYLYFECFNMDPKKQQRVYKKFGYDEVTCSKINLE